MVDNMVATQETKEGKKETCRCKHCHKKYTYTLEDVYKTKDSVYGFIQSVKCPYCNMRTVIH